MASRTEHERLEQLLRGQAEVLQEVHLILGEENKHDALLRATVMASLKEHAAELRGLDPNRVFQRGTIRALCVRYRLRFLPAGLFKGALPNTAIHAIRELERKATAPITGYMMLAPGARFKLCDSEVDPLLFVPLGDGTYYLVHRWGNDLSPWRAVWNWPLRNVGTLTTTVVLFACVLALLVPTWLISGDPQAGYWGLHRLLMMVWSSLVCASFTVFAWFAFFGQFSTEAWNSRYFNG